MDKSIKTAAFITMLLTAIIFAALIAVCVFVPRASYHILALDRITSSPAPLLISAYVGIAAAMWFLVRLFLIMTAVYRGNPFTRNTIRSLWQISLCCVAAACSLLLILIYYGWYSRFGLYICAFILLFGALSASVLAGVFGRAVEYKAENDLTV